MCYETINAASLEAGKGADAFFDKYKHSLDSASTGDAPADDEV